jgi:hypothetical protein
MLLIFVVLGYLAHCIPNNLPRNSLAIPGFSRPAFATMGLRGEKRFAAAWLVLLLAFFSFLYTKY